MKYSIKQVADISGVSTRTLRYYDQIDLLKPSGYTTSGYRLYDDTSLNRLQQILLYRGMEMKLEDIKAILDTPGFDILNALQIHQDYLREERDKVNRLLNTVGKTIRSQRGEIKMTAEEKFEGFKQSKLEENERLYGTEVREKYGEKTIERSNEKFMGLTEQDFKEMQSVEDALFEQLEKLSETEDVESDTGQLVYHLHRDWLMYSWAEYSAEAHQGLVEMYLADERFANYYNDRAGKAVVTLLRDAVVHHSGNKM